MPVLCANLRWHVNKARKPNQTVKYNTAVHVQKVDEVDWRVVFFDIFKNSNIYYFCRFSGLKNLSGPQLVFLYKLFTRVSRRIKIYTEIPCEIFELVLTVRTSGCYKDSVNFTDGFMSFIVYPLKEFLNFCRLQIISTDVWKRSLGWRVWKTLWDSVTPLRNFN